MKSKSVLVLGAGESGVSMARWCAFQGAQVRLADSLIRQEQAEWLQKTLPGIPLVTGDFDGQLLTGVDYVAISPGIDDRIPLLLQAKAQGLPLMGEMAFFAWALNTCYPVGSRPEILAVTGTNGKTTTTMLTRAMCAAVGKNAVAAGNIGPTALSVLQDYLENRRALPDCWVLELSSFQLLHCGAFHATVGAILNITEDHLDRHGDMACYAEAKGRILSEAVQVLNRQDDLVMSLKRETQPCVTFGLDRPGCADDFGLRTEEEGQWLVRGEQRLIGRNDIHLVGSHNIANVLAAFALVTQVSDNIEAMARAVADFRALAHRVEPVAQSMEGVFFYDDSKGTNVGATLAALKGLGQPLVLIAGGDGKGQDFTVMRSAVRKYVTAVVLIGRDAQKIADAWSDTGVPIEFAVDLPQAVRRAYVLGRKQCAVLLSPACASLDMFRNYIHRSEVFCAAALTIEGVTAL